KCLINTGSMLNVIRHSTACALQMPIAMISYGKDNSRGLITANGSINYYVGMILDVLVRIGGVTTMTGFQVT
ncbi:hypothetical protein B0J11DRAFT_446061, partial [Dendryphion nanum]